MSMKTFRDTPRKMMLVNRPPSLAPLHTLSIAVKIAVKIAAKLAVKIAVRLALRLRPVSGL